MYLERDADVLPVLEGNFMNFGIRVDQDGNLRRKEEDRQSTLKHHRHTGPDVSLTRCNICAETERTYCFTTVCNKTRRLLEGLLEVVFEPLVPVLFGAQLHEFTWESTVGNSMC